MQWRALAGSAVLADWKALFCSMARLRVPSFNQMLSRLVYACQCRNATDLDAHSSNVVQLGYMKASFVPVAVVAHLAEHQIVALVVAGSIPVDRPMNGSFRNTPCTEWQGAFHIRRLPYGDADHSQR